MSAEPSKNKVVLGMSGGVDSTTAALLLKEKGLEVTGLFFDIFCDRPDNRKTAELTAQKLGIDFIYKNVASEFESCVISNFCTEYLMGRTPNPCIICNPNIKFKILAQAADEIGAYYIATGHYAKIKKDEDKEKWFVHVAANVKKDQSYMLYRLPQSILSRFLTPLEDIESKNTIRELAREHELENAEAPDSQEICFIDNDDNYAAYIKRRGFYAPEGDFVDKFGNVLGHHTGILNYTIGQRKGLGITFGKPVFVTNINFANYQVTLGENSDLFRKEVFSRDNFFTSTGSNNMPQAYEGMSVLAKIRYAAKPANAVISTDVDGSIRTSFEEPQRAPTPGQSIVFYKDDCVIGGGYIE